MTSRSRISGRIGRSLFQSSIESSEETSNKSLCDVLSAMNGDARRRWNFDFESCCPLPGRYSWAPVVCEPGLKGELNKHSCDCNENGSSLTNPRINQNGNGENVKHSSFNYRGSQSSDLHIQTQGRYTENATYDMRSADGDQLSSQSDFNMVPCNVPVTRSIERYFNLTPPEGTPRTSQEPDVKSLLNLPRRTADHLDAGKYSERIFYTNNQSSCFVSQWQHHDGTTVTQKSHIGAPVSQDSSNSIDLIPVQDPCISRDQFPLMCSSPKRAEKSINQSESRTTCSVNEERLSPFRKRARSQLNKHQRRILDYFKIKKLNQQVKKKNQ